MTFKTNLPDRSCAALSGFSVLELVGRDSGAFLQSQTMNDCAAMAPGQWQWNGWLTPKGRVIAIFALLRLESERWLWVVPDYPAAELAPRLQRFVFRSKLDLKPLSDLVCAAGPWPDGLTTGSVQHGHGDEWCLGWSQSARVGQRALWLLPPGHAALDAAAPGVDAAWVDADLSQGLPRLPPSQREAWTPQMLSLERLAAFSLRKGCYPGQEIVARTHYLGQAKRGLARLSGAALEAGQAVEAGGAAVGTVVAANATGTRALAVVTLGVESALTCAQAACTREPLLEGLWNSR
jgi:folate-binding protein YgfZ